jgi:hypothetical protein
MKSLQILFKSHMFQVFVTHLSGAKKTAATRKAMSRSMARREETRVEFNRDLYGDFVEVFFSDLFRIL